MTQDQQQPDPTNRADDDSSPGDALAERMVQAVAEARAGLTVVARECGAEPAILVSVLLLDNDTLISQCIAHSMPERMRLIGGVILALARELAEADALDGMARELIDALASSPENSDVTAPRDIAL